jgi:hypothetical protein
MAFTRLRPAHIAVVIGLAAAGPAMAQAPALNVAINEIAWMGRLADANDEWIELHNNTGAPINLSGWTLIAADGTPNITLTGTIPAGGYFILERTDDNSVPGVAADLIYTGALGNPRGDRSDRPDDQRLSAESHHRPSSRDLGRSAESTVDQQAQEKEDRV